MFRFLTILAAATLASAPAFAHEGAGIVHFLTQPDHVGSLIATVAVPVLFWIVLRRKNTEE